MILYMAVFACFQVVGGVGVLGVLVVCMLMGYVYLTLTPARQVLGLLYNPTSFSVFVRIIINILPPPPKKKTCNIFKIIIDIIKTTCFSFHPDVSHGPGDGCGNVYGHLVWYPTFLW